MRYLTGALVLALSASLLAAGCGGEPAMAFPPPSCAQPAVAAVPAVPASVPGAPPAGPADSPPLRRIEDVPLPGPAVRFDYQSVDTVSGRLYVAHMNAGTLLVFDTRGDSVVADLPGFPSVHGVLGVPALGKVFAAATGERDVAVVDAGTLETTARLGPIRYPDGLAYAPGTGRVFVSDEAEGQELVLDARADTVIGRVDVGGEAGNTLYDPGSGCVLVAVQTRQELAAIDPTTDRVVGRYPLEGSDRPHGLAVDAARRLLFVADEGNATLLVVDLTTMTVLARHPVGRGPDVLALDPGLARLYVAAEGGVVSVFGVEAQDVRPLGELHIPHAHTVAVDPTTHRVYLPLEDVDGRPVLRILAPG